MYSEGWKYVTREVLASLYYAFVDVFRMIAIFPSDTSVSTLNENMFVTCTRISVTDRIR